MGLGSGTGNTSIYIFNHQEFNQMKEAEKFKTWLTKRGAVVLAPTNQWEVVRFKTVNGVSVVYTRQNGHLTFTGESEEAYRAYKGNKVWKAVDRKRKAMRAHKSRLAARDGKKCFACLAKLGFDELTIEHILSFSHGGTDNDNNLCLVCQPCNKLLGNKPVARKIEMIIQRRQSKEEIILFPPMPNGVVESALMPGGVIKMESTPKGPNFFHKIFKDKL